MADFHRRDSFLKNTLVYDGFLGINNLPRIPRNVSDVSYKIPRSFHERPDLLAYEAYNNTHLWWIFAMRNPDILKDPIRDFKEGTIIRLPDRGVIEGIIG